MKKCSVGLTSCQNVTDPDRHTVKESSLPALSTIMTQSHIHEELSQKRIKQEPLLHQLKDGQSQMFNLFQSFDY